MKKQWQCPYCASTERHTPRAAVCKSNTCFELHIEHRKKKTVHGERNTAKRINTLQPKNVWQNIANPQDTQPINGMQLPTEPDCSKNFDAIPNDSIALGTAISAAFLPENIKANHLQTLSITSNATISCHSHPCEMQALSKYPQVQSISHGWTSQPTVQNET